MPETSIILPITYIADPEMGGYTATVLGLGAFGEGSTKREALADLREAVLLHVAERGFAEVSKFADDTCQEGLVLTSYHDDDVFFVD